MKPRTYLFFFIIIASILTTGYVIDQSLDLEDPQEVNSIPNQAIRLRILANSDTVQDQWLKRQIRDQIVNEMKTWVEQPKSINEARRLIQQRLPKLNQLTEQTIARHGFHYPVQLTFGTAPFPTKLYGDQVYSAGKYEALLVKIGQAKGDNWWCVLFPPLCFVDMKNGDAVPTDDPSVLSASLKQNRAYASSIHSVEQPQPKKVQVRSFLADSYQHVMEEWF